MRVQLIMDDWQVDALRAEAQRRGKSMSAIVREILDSHLGVGSKETPPARRLEGLVGLFGQDHPNSGDSAAERHDELLYGPGA